MLGKKNFDQILNTCRQTWRIGGLTILLLLLAMALSFSSPAQAAQQTTASTLDSAPVVAASVAEPADVSTASLEVEEAEGGGVSGMVFRDYNANGAKDSREPGISGITVTAYDASGASVASATTGSDGTYDLAVGSGTDVRVEFTDIPAHLQAGASGSDSKTTVTFATSPATGVDVGLNNPAHYCQQDPTLVTPCYIFGDQAAQTADVLVSFDYDAGCLDGNLDGNCDNAGESFVDPAPTHLASGQDMGTTWGVAYQGSSDTLFVTSFMKRHTGFRNHGETGIIYRVDGASTGGTGISAYVDLDALGFDTGTDPHPTSAISCGSVANAPDDDCWGYDPDSWDAVGKMSFGDIDISDDGNSLWTINLLDRKLYQIPVQAAPLAANDITTYDIPSPADCVDAGTNLRPFATGFNDGLVYVGMVCTAETTQDAADMRAYVYTMDPAVGAGSFAEVLNTPLNYPRGNVVVDNGGSPVDIPAEWNPWVTTFTTHSAGKAWSNEYGYPQPWLTDIEFDNGDLIIGIRDRYGDQMGYKSPSTDLTDTELYSADVAGDILRACPNGSGSWDLESDGSCGGVTTQGANSNDQGPGGGEFYFQDDYPIHDEISVAGLVQVPGSPVVVETVFDPIYDFNEYFDGGIIWLNNETGERSNAYRLFSSNDNDPDTFGKAGGLGDMEALCAPAPIEIGNRVWQDSNGNGIQDPGEPVLAGVTVKLYDMDNSGNEIGSVTTDANGNYVFGGVNNANISGSLLTNRNYEIRIELSDANLNGLVPTTADQGDDNHDSDATRNGGFAVIALTTGDKGANNHTYDFGFEAEATYSLGDTVWYDTNQNGIQDAGEPGVENVTVELYSDATCTTSSGQTVTTDANGLYQFTDLGTGTYCVQFTNIPAGWTISPPDQGDDDAVDSDTNNNAQITNISLGPDDMTNDMGIYQSGTVGNQVWCEASDPANTSFESGTDNPLAGIGVMIYADNDCDEAADGDAIASMNTDADGLFSFTGLTILPSGSNTCYVVQIDSSDPDLGTCDQPITPTTDPVILTPENPTDEDSDFGFEEQPKYTLGDTVWYDSNQDGIQDNGETGVQNITAELFSDATCTTSTGMTTVTDAAGFYEFASLMAGDYCVQFSNIPAGWSVSPADEGGDDAADSDATVTADATIAQITNITLNANDPTNDMGIYTTGSIGDQVWCEGSDPADNGYDGGTSDSPLAGILVNLYADSDCDDAADTPATALMSMDTDANGQYSFTGLTVTPPGAPTCYVVQVDTTDADVGSCTNTITPDGYGVDLDTDNPDNDTSDFGFVEPPPVPTLTIGDTVWADQNGDGVQDAGEPGVSGVTVTLYDADGNVVNTTTTDADGNYLFTSDSDGNPLPAGDYQIGFTPPAGYVFTTPDQGGDDNNDSDADPNTGQTPTFTMAAGDTNLTLDAGLYKPAVIGNYVWLDEDENGKQDAGENGIPNVKVILLDADGNPVAETTTDANGGYLFPDLAPGSYFVDLDESTLPGMSQTPLATGNDIGADLNNQDHSGNGYPVTVGSGEENLTADFGYNLNPGSIGDSIWVDTDGDGVQDDDEVGIEEVCVELYSDPDGDGTYDNLVATTTTNANGNYVFNDVTPGAYVVKVCDSNFDPGGPLEGYDPTGDPDQPGIPATDPDNMTTTPIVVGPGDVIDTIDFGYQPPAPLGSIGDTIWFDVDASGTATQDAGENGIPGLTVALIQDTNGNGVQDAGEPIIATVTTDENGNYLFGDLPLDTSYIVWVNDTDNVLANMSQTYDKDGLDTPNMSAITLTADNPNDLEQDFSYTPEGHGPTDGIIGDTIYLDTDGDGTQDDNEPGLEGIIVILTDSDGNQVTTTTDENGNYTFGDIDPTGTYTVTIAPENFEPGGVLEGMNNTGDPDGGNDSTSSVDLSQSPNGINLDQDFGFAPPANEDGKIGNLIWLDTNADGVYDPATESPIAGVTVDLYNDLNNNGKVDAGEPLIGTTTTANIDPAAYGSDGNYIFEGLPAGSYVVDVTDVNGVLGGHSHSEGTPGENNNSQTDPYGVTIEAGGENLTADFGYYVKGAAVGNVVWADINGDGIQNDGEPGMADVTVTLDITYPDGTTVQVVETTNAEGYYIFDNLLLNPAYDGQGIYATPGVGGGDEPYFNISVATPAGYTPTQVDQGGNDLLDSDDHNGTQAIAQQGNSNVPTTATDPATEEPIASYDFGFIPPVTLGSIGDYVWMDTDGDGVQDPGESGLPNVTVKLIDENGNIITTTTDENGNYIFNDVPAGTYTIQIDPSTLPEDLMPSYDLDGILNHSTSITLNPGQNIDTVDFGYKGVTPELGAIGNYVWLDEDSDGYQDAGEAGIPNVIVQLQDGDGNLIDTTTTDTNGHYLFPDLPAGVYSVVIAPSNQDAGGALEGLTQSSAQPIPSGSDFGNQTTPYTISLGEGEENLTADFGYNWNPSDDVDNNSGTAVIGDTIWVDTDGDGMQDPNEVGVPGVTVNLYNDPDGDGVYDNPVGSTTTDENGNYIFNDLTPGAYVVEVVPTGSPIDGYTQTGDPDQPGQPATNPDNMTTTPVILAPGDVYLNADFGYQPTDNSPTGSIGDTIWFDADASGTSSPDAGEYGIPGITVALIKDTNGNGTWDDGEPIIASDTTDENGNYLFDGLPLDTSYIVWVNDTNNVLDGLKPTYDADGLSSPEMSATTLTAGSPDNLDQDFSYTPVDQSPGQGLIGDTIYLDIDGDGTQDPNEPALEGVIVVLTDQNGNETTTTTDENGHYYFEGLNPTGTYNVTVAPENFQPGGVLEGLDNSGDPDGGNDDTSAVDLSTGPINLDQDFGYTPDNGQVGSVGNLVWFDSNANGQYDSATEMPIGGVTVDIYRDLNGNGQVDAGEPLFGSTVTMGTINSTDYGSNGNYLFSGLPAGDYVVDVTDVNGVLAGYSHSLGTAGSDNNSQTDPYAVSIPAGGQNLTADFGYYTPEAAIGNFVWVDTNEDGMQDAGESGLANVPVTLEVTYPDGTTVTVVTTTNTDGYYSFGNLLTDEDYDGMGTPATPGTGGGDEPYFNISVSTPDGYTPTLVDQGGNDLVDSDDHSGTQAEPKQGQTAVPMTVTDGSTEQAIASYDFGFQPPANLGSIGDLIWLDSNGDGVQDPDEVGIADVTVNLLDSDGNVIATTTTGPDGTYLFNEVPAGTYTIKVDPSTLPDGVVSTFDLDGTPDSETTITLGEGENKTDVDFGYEPPAQVGSIGDYVWMDSNGDGVQDPDEQPIPNVSVILTDENGNQTTVTTDENGKYLFPDLPAGQYTITIDPNTLPEGVQQTFDLDGTLDHSTTITLAPGQDKLDVDFGYEEHICMGTIGDTVFSDLNGNGTQNDNEPGMADVIVKLVGAGEDGLLGTADDILISTQVTDENGKYQFINLPAGLYQVQVDETSVREGFALTTGNEPELTIQSNCEQFNDADFGYAPSVCERSVMYGVHDAGSFNTQFFKLDLGTGQSSALGPQYNNYDVEAIEMDPITNKLYAIAAGDGDQDGKFFELDKETGALTEIGNTGTGDANEIVSAAFAADGTLWAYQQNVGLVTVDVADGTSNLVWGHNGPGIANWEGLAWDPNGSYLYGAEGTKMYRFDPADQSVTQVCDDTFLPDATEALDFRFDGKLLGGWHNATDNALSIFEIDMDTCSIIPTSFDTPYTDVESLTSEQCVEDGILEGQVTNAPDQEGRASNAGIQVKLEVDLNRDGEFSNEFTSQTTTDTEGRYRFVNLPKGDYQVSTPGSGASSSFNLEPRGAQEDVNIDYTSVSPPTEPDHTIYLPIVVGN